MAFRIIDCEVSAHHSDEFRGPDKRNCLTHDSLGYNQIL